MPVGEMLAQRSNIYGSTNAAGNAHVLIGNKYNGHGDTYQINSATIFVTDDIRHGRHHGLRGVKRSFEDTDCVEEVKPGKHQHL